MSKHRFYAVMTCGLLALAGVSACGGAPGVRRHLLTFETFSNEKPLAGVTVTLAGQPLGATRDDGTLVAQINARKGVRLPLEVACPVGYVLKEAPREVAVRPVVSLDPELGSKGVVTRVSCEPAQRDLLVTLHAHGGPVAGLPVLLDGTPLGHLGPEGIMQTMLRVPNDGTYSLTIETESQPRITPVNPELVLLVNDKRPHILLEQAFDYDPPKRKRRRRRRLPVRLQ